MSGITATPAQRAGASALLLAALIGGAVTLNASAASATTIDSLTANGTMYNGDVLRSPGGRVYLTMQGDGNLVIYRTTGPSSRVAVWSTNTPNQAGAYAVNQDDGNLVIYKPTANNQRVAIWQSGTGGRGAARLLMQDDENLVLYRNADGQPTWSRKSGVIHAAPAGISALRQNIVNTALREVGPSRSVEGSSNCNYYSSQVSSYSKVTCTTPSGAPGRPEAWCAQFARWTYKIAGAGNYDRMDAGAVSTKRYGTWRDNPANNVSGIQPGDLIAFRLNTGTTNDDHVGIVVEVNGAALTTVEGNTSSGRVSKVTSHRITDSSISGYASPVAR